MKPLRIELAVAREGRLAADPDIDARLRDQAMTPAEFLQIARAKGIRSAVFDLDDSGDRDECYVCTPATNGWRVFYAERGLQRQAQEFATRSDALQHLLTLLGADRTAKRRAP